MTADVCIIAEGTYPFVTGGVSSWIHDLIRGLPQLRFAVFHIGATAGEGRPAVYALPDNVVSLVTVGIHGGDEQPGPGAALSPAACAEIRDLHHDMRDRNTCDLGRMLAAIGTEPSTHQLLYGKPSWEIVRQLYDAHAPDVSFLDYYWTWRFTHLPMFRLMRAEMPEAAVYHTVSTGWAGLLGAMTRVSTGRSLLLTEHGIYARERRMDIDQADWIYIQRQLPMSAAVGSSLFFKDLWNRLFTRLARVTYTHADLVLSIFEGNRLAQIEDGADPDKTMVVPNGIDVERFAALERVPPEGDEFRIGFVGRVVPIKDVKTFLRAFKIVAEALPGARAVIVGPLDEDAEYVGECRALSAALGLDERLRFVGPADVREVYRRLDVLVLTSVSEGVPLVVLEAGAAGLPVVSTDVGACRDLLHGLPPEDRALGQSGFVTRLADPAGTAEALLALARDRGMRQEMGAVGRARVRARYRASDVIGRYREIYARLAAAPAATAG
jgi:polysaccharide biosynthesis protein PelF